MSKKLLRLITVFLLTTTLVFASLINNSFYSTSTSINLQDKYSSKKILHQDEINWLKDDKNIQSYANSKNITIEEARKELTQTALSLIDDNWKKVLKETNSDAENYLLNNVASIKNTTDLERANSFQNETVAINNIDFYKKYVHPDIQKDIATVLKDDIENKATEYKEVFEKIKEQGVEKTLNVAKEKLGNYYDENTYLEMLKDGGKVLQSIIEDSVNSTVKLGYNLTTSPKNLAEIYNISVEEATVIQAVLVVAAANQFGIKKTKAADNVLDLGVGKTKTKEFQNEIYKLPAGERVAMIKQESKKYANEIGLIKDNKLSSLNNRDVYVDKNGIIFSLDTQHGEWERINPKNGKHEGSFELFDITKTTGKAVDNSGQHNLKVK